VFLGSQFEEYVFYATNETPPHGVKGPPCGGVGFLIPQFFARVLAKVENGDQ
jgi:hypothetical protein